MPFVLAFAQPFLSAQKRKLQRHQQIDRWYSCGLKEGLMYTMNTEWDLSTIPEVLLQPLWQNQRELSQLWFERSCRSERKVLVSWYIRGTLFVPICGLIQNAKLYRMLSGCQDLLALLTAFWSELPLLLGGCVLFGVHMSGLFWIRIGCFVWFLFRPQFQLSDLGCTSRIFYLATTIDWLGDNFLDP